MRLTCLYQLQCTTALILHGISKSNLLEPASAQSLQSSEDFPISPASASE